jgi:hypothetical protein
MTRSWPSRKSLLVEDTPAAADRHCPRDQDGHRSKGLQLGGVVRPSVGWLDHNPSHDRDGRVCRQLLPRLREPRTALLSAVRPGAWARRSTRGLASRARGGGAPSLRRVRRQFGVDRLLVPDRRRGAATRPSILLTHSGDTREVVLTFWRALRRLQAALAPETFSREWLALFPTFEMSALTGLIESWKTGANDVNAG